MAALLSHKLMSTMKIGSENSKVNTCGKPSLADLVHINVRILPYSVLFA